MGEKTVGHGLAHCTSSFKAVAGVRILDLVTRVKLLLGNGQVTALLLMRPP